MKEVFFYNWKREPVMQWSDLNIIGVEEAGLVSFDVKVSKSIFEVFIWQFSLFKIFVSVIEE